jgi:hypothetical protein
MVNRRRFIAAALALPAAWRASGGGSAAAGDAAPLIQRAIDEAERSGRAVMIPAGATLISRLTISGNVRLVGAGRSSRLIALGPGPLLSIGRAESVAIENVAFDGAGKSPGGEAALIEAKDVADLRLVDCALERASGYGLKLERCGGRVERSSFRDLSQSALHSLDAIGLTIADNHVDGCGANGFQTGVRRLLMTAPSSGTIASSASAPTPAATDPTATPSASFAPAASQPMAT